MKFKKLVAIEPVSPKMHNFAHLQDIGLCN